MPLSWKIAGVNNNVAPATWTITDISGSADVAAPAINWQVAKLSGTAANVYSWKITKLSGTSVKQIPNWQVISVQARTITTTGGYMWAYVNGTWIPAQMYARHNGGWISLEPQ